MDKDDYREWHKGADKALKYENNLYAADSYDSNIWEIEKSYIIKEINLIRNPEIKYLDFACGTGRIISFVEPYVTESTGVDISKDMLDQANKKVKRSNLINCDFTKDDVIGNKKYDLITAFRFFLNAQEEMRMEVMPLLSDKMSDNGIFIFNIHGNTLSYYFFPIILEKLGIKKGKLNNLSFFKIRKMIHNSRLELIRTYGIGFIPSSFYRIFKPLGKFFMNFDKAISSSRFLKYFARDLIFICARN